MCLFSWGMLKNTVTLNWPILPGIQSDVTNLVTRDGIAPIEIKKRHAEELRGIGGKTATICYADSRKSDFLDGNPHSSVYEQKS